MNHIKKLALTLLIAGFTFINLSSCKKIIAAAYGGSDVSVPELQFILPQIYFVQPNEIPLGNYSFYFNLDSTVKASTGGVFGANSVNSIKIKQIIIKVINPDAYDDLANIDSARVTLESNANTTPVELFHIGFPNTYADSYTYTTTNSPELLPYIKGNLIVYNVFGRMRNPTNKPLGLSVDILLRAD